MASRDESADRGQWRGKALGRYHLLEQIGSGGMGVVYRARDDALRREVAVKLLPAEFSGDAERTRRFEQEARAAGTLSHPNILAVHDVGTHESTPYMVSELLLGETLRRRLEADRLPLQRAIDYAIQIASGLVAAHDKHIVHRDLKPENLFVTRDDCVKILDFGLAKFTRPRSTAIEDASTETASMHTEVGAILGTPRYMAPEQVRGQEADSRSDIFAFGAILYEMLAGRPAFAGPTMADIISAILKEEPADLHVTNSRIAPRLDHLVRHCLEKNPENRFQSARDLLFDLQEIAGTPMVAGPVPLAVRRRKRWPAVLVGAMALTVVGAVAIVKWWPRGQVLDSLAVLPFHNASGDSDLQYLSDGITESLIDALSKLPSLRRVIARSSVAAFTGENVNVLEVGRRLGVSAILTGRMLQRGQQLTVSAELVDVRDNRHLWGHKFTRALSDLAAVESEITAQISESLRLQMSQADRAGLARQPTDDSEAYQLYLKGRFFARNLYSKQNATHAVEYMEKAIARDPNFALAHAGLAEALYGLTNIWAPPVEVMPRARRAAERALELDGTLAGAHRALACVVAYYDFDWVAGEREFKRAIELNPSYASAYALYGVLQIHKGQLEEAARLLTRAQELDPLSLDTRWFATWVPFYARDWNLATEQLRALCRMDTLYYPAIGLLGETLEQQGDFEAAEAALRTALRLDGNAWLEAALGRVYAKSGRIDEARRVLADLLARRDYVTPYGIATLYASLGDADRAFAQLEKAFDDHCEDLAYLKVDPRMDPLRGKPRFDALLRRVGLPL